MINVLNIIDTGGPGGAETVFLQTATRLDPARFRSVAVVGSSGWLSDRLDERAVKPWILPAHGSFNVKYLRSLLRIARETDAAVITAHLYGSAVYASILGAIGSTPVISILHGQTDVSPSDRLAAIKSTIVRRGSQRVVFVSKRLQEDLSKRLRLPASQCVVIPNGVDTDRFHPASDRSIRSGLGLSDETLLIGAVGNVRPPKAYDVLLTAAHILFGRSERFHFLIAGECSGELGERLSQISRSLGIERRVTFLGLRSDVARVLNNLDVFVLSSSTEGFSIACIEAMACGVPVVATRSGGPEQILEGNAGVLVPTGDPKALADAIERVASSRELAASLAATAMTRVHQEFSLAKMLSRYEDLLTEVVYESLVNRTARDSGPA